MLIDFSQPGNLRRALGDRKKIAIVGFCQPHRDWAPYFDPEFVIAGLNRGYIFMPRSDIWFEMHGPDIFTLQDRRPGTHVDYLRNYPGPVIMHQRQPEVPNAIPLPLEELAAMLGPWVWRIGDPDQSGQMMTWSTEGSPYLSSSIAYEIALAIYEGFEEIHLFGIDLSTESEYHWQKPGVEFLLGVAVGKGIKVYVPEQCPLLKGTLYGRAYMSPSGEQISMTQLQTRMASLIAEKDQLQAQINQIAGAHKELVGYVQVQLPPGINHEKVDQRRQEMEQMLGQLQARLQQTLGSLKETAYWIHQTPEGQDPQEAIEQLRALKATNVDEGPVEPIDAMMYDAEAVRVEIPAPKVDENGHQHPKRRSREKAAVGED